MGVEIRPKFNPAVRGIVFESEGKALADALRRIHAFSTKQGLQPITEYVDASEDDDGDDDSDMNSTWHPSAAGLQAVRALAEAIRSDSKADQRWNKEDPDGLETLLDDLDELARCLEHAVAKDAQFRLEIG